MNIKSSVREYLREVFYEIDPSTLFLTFDWDWLAKSVNAYGKNVLKSVKLPSMGVFVSKNGFSVLDLPDFAVERNVKSKIGFVTLVTFRQCVQYAQQPLKK